MKSLFLAVASVILMAGCASADSTMKAIDSNAWEVVQLGARELSADKMTLPTLEFDSEKKTITGNTGCNSYSGSYDLDFHGLTFGKMISTKKACPDAAIETSFLDAMHKVTKFNIDGDNLTLMDGAGVELLQAVAVAAE